jgi:hypothetical protein
VDSRKGWLMASSILPLIPTFFRVFKRVLLDQEGRDDMWSKKRVASGWLASTLDHQAQHEAFKVVVCSIYSHSGSHGTRTQS